MRIIAAGALLLASCTLPAVDDPQTAREDAASYVAKPLRPDNCGTPFKPVKCEPGPLVIRWTPRPEYPIITEPLPDLTPPPEDIQ